VIHQPVEHTVDPGRVPDAPLQPAYGQGGLRDVFRRRYLLRLLVRKELQARYSGSALGLLWSYVMPLWRFLAYYFVVGIVLQLHDDIPNFPLHLFCGLVFVTFFTETFQAGTRSVVQNKALVRKMAMPREMFPVSSVMVSGFHTIPQVIVLTAGAMLYGWSPGAVELAGGLLGLVVLALFGMGLALIFSACNVYFRDFQQVVSMLTIFTHWAVPMIYPLSRVTESAVGGTWVETVYLANPLTEAVLLLQNAFWLPTCDGLDNCTYAEAMPSHLYTRGFVMLGVGVVFLLFSQWLFTRLESKFAERL
jgi:ABC-2 type transport system permease protein